MVSRPSILVVDDEPNSLFGICQVLTDEGFQTIAANNGQEALEKLRTNSVDLIITDEKMPDLSGTELLLEVRETHPSVPVILITAYGSVLMAVEALRKGAFYFFEKPIVRMFFSQSEVHRWSPPAVDRRSRACFCRVFRLRRVFSGDFLMSLQADSLDSF